MAGKPSFSAAFCALERCLPEDFPRRIVVRCVPWYWRFAAWLVLGARPSVLAVELRFSASLGSSLTLDDVMARMREYRGDIARANVERRAIRWGFRLRTSHVMSVARHAWSDARDHGTETA